MSERNTYNTTILATVSPLQSIEFIKLRLNESRAVNSSFIEFFEEYLKVEEHYAAGLNNVLLKGSKLFDDGTKFNKELETLGMFSPIWNSFIGEINTELKFVDTKTKTLNLDVLEKLRHFERKYKGNSENLNNLRRLSYRIEQLAAKDNKTTSQQHNLDELRREWETRVPGFVDIVENYDFNRFILLKDVFLSLQSSNQDTLPELTKQTEKSLEFVLNFDPNDEIDRFANEASTKNIQFDQSDLIKNDSGGATTTAAEAGAATTTSPEKANKHHSFMGRSSHHHKQDHAAVPVPPQQAQRQTSMASTATTGTNTTLMNNGFTGSSPSKTPKEKTKLKSRVGSIFGRKKKDKKLPYGKHDAIAESPGASTNTSRSSLPLTEEANFEPTPPPHRNTNTAGSVVQDNHSNRRQSDVSDLYRPSAMTGATATGAGSNGTVQEDDTTATIQPLTHRLSLASHPLTPSSAAKEMTGTTNGKNNESSGVAEGEDYFTAEQEADQAQAQAAAEAGPAPDYELSSNHVPPPVPASRGTTGTFALGATAEEKRSSISHSTSSGGAGGAHALPPPPPPVPRQRKDINSTLFVGLEQNITGNNQDYQNTAEPPMYRSEENSSAPSPIHRQSTGSSLLARQNTGTLPAAGFIHPDLVHPGLNSSVAEVINASFKDGQFSRGNVVSELALSYIVSSEADKVPSMVKLSFAEAAQLGRLLVNNQFMKQTSETEFEIFDLAAIHLKTVGAIKYTYAIQSAAVSVLPVWRFEPHQASVVISIKLTPEVLSKLPSEDDTVVLSNLIVSVAVAGANTQSAATRPTGSFNKEKNRITWVYKGPVVLGHNKEERIIARFATDGLAREGDNGVQVKFTINDEDGAKLATTGLQLHSQNIYSIGESDPFDQTVGQSQQQPQEPEHLQDDWKVVPTVKTLIAGKYDGRS